MLIVGTCAGALMIAAFERYRIPLRDWMGAEPGAPARRLKWGALLLAALLVAPLLAFAARIWSLGGRVLRAREFPPPGLRVIRATRVITGDAAVLRGRLLRMLALGGGIAAAVLWLLLWRLVSLLGARAA
jgi:hypothetical protein